MYFSLAKAEEDIGNIKEASENLIIGNKLKKLIKYNREEVNLLKDIKNSVKTTLKVCPEVTKTMSYLS